MCLNTESIYWLEITAYILYNRFNQVYKYKYDQSIDIYKIYLSMCIYVLDFYNLYILFNFFKTEFCNCCWIAHFCMQLWMDHSLLYVCRTQACNDVWLNMQLNYQWEKLYLKCPSPFYDKLFVHLYFIMRTITPTELLKKIEQIRERHWYSKVV